MIVYRIENQAGEGMYAADHCIYQCPSYEDFGNHKGPQSDNRLLDELRLKNWSYDIPQHFSFGFSSVEQMRTWLFEDVWLLWLADNGFILAIIETDDVIAGDTQCIFIKPETYQKVDIKKFFKLA